MIKTFLKSPMGCLLCLFFFTSTLIDKTRGVGRVLAISTNGLAGYQSGYSWGYKTGFMTAIVIQCILIAKFLFRLYNHWNNNRVAGI